MSPQKRTEHFGVARNGGAVRTDPDRRHRPQGQAAPRRQREQVPGFQSTWAAASDHAIAMRQGSAARCGLKVAADGIADYVTGDETFAEWAHRADEEALACQHRNYERGTALGYGRGVTAEVTDGTRSRHAPKPFRDSRFQLLELGELLLVFLGSEAAGSVEDVPGLSQPGLSE